MPELLDREHLMQTAVVVWEDRYTDTEAYPFTNPDKAVAWAKKIAHEYYGSYSDLDEEINQGMREGGWIYFAESTEAGGCIWVALRELIEGDEPPDY